MAERLLVLLLVFALTACASTMEGADLKLGQSVQGLPGLYDRQGDGAEAMVLVIVPIFVPSLTGYRFYVQEMAAQDPRRVTAQRVLSFDPGKGGRFVQTSWSLSDPARWRTGPANPDLFKSMVKDDLKPTGRSEVTAARLTAPELAFDAAGRIAIDANDARAVRYRKR